MNITKRENDPKILLFDIETAPNLGYYFELYKEGNILDNVKSWYMLSYSAKWLGEKGIVTKTLPMYSPWKKDKTDDSALVKSLWQLFDEADVLVGHNSNQFDIKKMNALFIKHGMNPPSPYAQVDTKVEAKKHFRFDSNKLDDLGKYLGVGRKLKHQGMELWFDCMAGKKEAWKIMADYNEQDVLLLERVYMRLLPWMKNHPNRNVYNDINCCPKCGGKKIIARGFSYSKTGKTQRYQCKDCGGWCLGKTEQVKGVVVR
jgi:hypothetical protein